MESGRSLQKAPWITRLIAEAVDVAAWSLAFLPLVLAASLALVPGDDSSEPAFVLIGLALTIGALLLIAALYKNGQSVGKRIMGTQVVYAETGAPLSWAANFVVRSVLLKGVVISIASQITFGVFWLLNYLWPLWDENRQAIHDKMMSTHVVLKPAATAQSLIVAS